ncbi:putative histidine kinase CKI1-like [Capsicum annuum]|nr:putative histidine kinase CKI1-like [Capsicum annuum]
MYRKLTQKSHKLSNFPSEISGGLPVIGHLLQFSGTDSIPFHRKLSSLADKYGPIFTFRLGIPRVLVVSSYDAVKDCLNINDKVFAAWPGSLVGEYIGYNNAMLFLARYGDYWRKIRKIVINEVLSSNNFPVGGDDVSFTVDGDEFNFLVTGDQSPVSGENLDFPVTGDHFPMTGDDFPVDGDDISFIVDGDNVIKPKKQPLTEIAPDCLISGANLDFPVTGGDFQVKVNITNWIEKLTLSLIMKMIAGKSNGRVEKGGNEEEEEAERFKKGLKDFMSIGFVLWDAFPIPLFKWIDIQGHVKFMKRTFRDIDCVLQSWLDEHVKKREC